MKPPKRRSARTPRGSRLDAPRRSATERAADRALFEQELERLESQPPDKLDASEPDEARSTARGARFARRVARSEVDPEAVLDLHGLDRETAAARLRRFLSDARAETVLVVHGRGEGILAAVAIDQLDRHPRVAEHVVAPGRWGGAGARLARLRR
jgi:DNA-nicking Smr family endonuclease